MTQLHRHLDASIPVVHTIQVLDRAYRRLPIGSL
jgi:hypothetical protein